MAVRCRALVAIPAAALALAGATLALGDAATVLDPDEPNVSADADIQWVAVEHPPSVSGQLVRHTIRTRAPYAHPPHLHLRRLDGESGTYRYYSIRGGTTLRGGDEPTTVWKRETPTTAPDTVSYTFSLSQIGNPGTYEWKAYTWRPIPGDQAPDDWAVHRIAPGPIAPATTARSRP